MADDDIVSIDCGETLTIAESGQLYATLLAELAEGREVQPDVSQIQRIDAAGVQVLLGFCREAALQGQTVAWGNPSEAFCKSIALLGLESEMGIKTNSDNNEE